MGIYLQDNKPENILIKSYFDKQNLDFRLKMVYTDFGAVYDMN